MTERRKRLAILHSRAAPRGARHHMVMVIADHLRARGIEVVDLYGTNNFVPADMVFVHADVSLVPPDVARFAQQYPVQINAGAVDIRKTVFADGLLHSESHYPAPVIVKSDLNYGGEPELRSMSRMRRAVRKAGRLLAGGAPERISAKAGYRIFPSLAAVPPAYFAAGNVVQKLMLEKDGDKNLLREYMFLGNLHYENIERSSDEIITEDEHVSCEPFVPHPRLLALRRHLQLDYGKIDYVMVRGEPFIFDANKTIGLGARSGTDQFGAGLDRMLDAFAREIHRALTEGGNAPFRLADPRPSVSGRTGALTQRPQAARIAARA